MAAIGNSPTQQAFTPAIDYFSGNGSTTAFTLSRPVASVAQVQVTIDNVAQNPSSAFTVSANTITFTSAPLSGTNNIYVYYTSPITQVIAPSQGTVQTAQLGNITNIASGNSSLTLQTGSSPTTAITVDTSQNVGIGTSSPTALLDVAATAPVIKTTGTTGTSFYRANNTGGSFYFGIDSSTGGTFGVGNYSRALYSSGAYPMVFFTNDTERMRIISTGDVGIGTTTPKVRLAGKVLSINGTDSGANYQASIELLVNGASAGELWANSSDFVIGSYSTQPMIFRTQNTERMRIDSNGYLRCPGVYNQTNPNAANVFVGTGGDLYRSTSSLKYKKNIETSVHGLTELLNLRSVTYKSNNPDNGEQVFGGFIAEEVHDAGLTEFVQYAEDGSPDALAYGNMVALCVKAIQELKAINDTQAETINALTARIVALENR